MNSVSLVSRCYYYLDFTDEETEAQRLSNQFYSPTACRRWLGDPNLCRLITDVCFTASSEGLKALAQRSTLKCLPWFGYKGTKLVIMCESGTAVYFSISLGCI